MRVRLPHNNWRPRNYQTEAWNYWIRDSGRHLELVWNRRAGKDDLALHGTAVKAHERIATYWHMLPLANQVKKAIWNAVNPHTGKRRIDEAFPRELRANTNEHEMFIRFKNGSTWQCIGSDNYEGAIGSPPAGIVYSEWAQANPTARALLRPIITENEGWQLFITTPRGKNHAYRTFRSAQKNPDAFAQLLTVHDTGTLSPEQLQKELMEYVDTYGEDMGLAYYEQEYECSFSAAILGAYWGREMSNAEKEGRICSVPHDPDWPVYVATDLGRTDDFSCWWYQVIGGEIHVLEHIAESGQDPDWFASQLLGKQVYINIVRNGLEVEYGNDIEGLEHRKAYRYGAVTLPHDGAAKTFAAKGKSVEEQLASVFSWSKVKVIPALSKQDQIQAGRKAINRAVFDESCEQDEGIEGLKQYQREWDDEKKTFKKTHLHNWCSHRADAWMQLGVAWEHELLPKESESVRFPKDRTINEMIEMVKRRRTG